MKWILSGILLYFITLQACGYSVPHQIGYHPAGIYAYAAAAQTPNGVRNNKYRYFYHNAENHKGYLRKSDAQVKPADSIFGYSQDEDVDETNDDNNKIEKSLHPAPTGEGSRGGKHFTHDAEDDRADQYTKQLENQYESDEILANNNLFPANSDGKVNGIIKKYIISNVPLPRLNKASYLGYNGKNKLHYYTGTGPLDKTSIFLASNMINQLLNYENIGSPDKFNSHLEPNNQNAISYDNSDEINPYYGSNGLNSVKGYPDPLNGANIDLSVLYLNNDGAPYEKGTLESNNPNDLNHPYGVDLGQNKPYYRANQLNHQYYSNVGALDHTGAYLGPNQKNKLFDRQPSPLDVREMYNKELNKPHQLYYGTEDSHDETNTNFGLNEFNQNFSDAGAHDVTGMHLWPNQRLDYDSAGALDDTYAFVRPNVPDKLYNNNPGALYGTGTYTWPDKQNRLYKGNVGVVDKIDPYSGANLYYGDPSALQGKEAYLWAKYKIYNPSQLDETETHVRPSKKNKLYNDNVGAAGDTDTYFGGNAFKQYYGNVDTLPAKGIYKRPNKINKLYNYNLGPIDETEIYVRPQKQNKLYYDHAEPLFNNDKTRSCFGLKRQKTLSYYNGLVHSDRNILSSRDYGNADIDPDIDYNGLETVVCDAFQCHAYAPSGKYIYQHNGGCPNPYNNYGKHDGQPLSGGNYMCNDCSSSYESDDYMKNVY